MDLNVKVNSNMRIRAFYLFFIISGIQIGVGVMGEPKYVFLDAGQDSWLAILIAYAAVTLVLWVMLLILKSYGNADIFGIQVDVFGKWIGKLLGTLYILHFGFSLLIVLMTYIDVMHLFTFPRLNTWIVAGLLLSLIVYCVAGGLRVIVGFLFLFFFFANGILLFLAYQPIFLIDVLHYQPVLEASATDLLKGAKSTTFTLTGFEIIFLIYPFIQNQKQAWRPMFLGITWSIIILLLNTFITIGYFSSRQMQTLEWAVLSLFDTVTLPFIDRFDVIVVIIWMTVALSTMMLLMWAVTQGMERIYHVPKRTTLYISALGIVIISGFMDNHHLIMTLNDKANDIDFWIVFIYPLVLLPVVKLKNHWRNRWKRGKQT